MHGFLTDCSSYFTQFAILKETKVIFSSSWAFDYSESYEYNCQSTIRLIGALSFTWTTIKITLYTLGIVAIYIINAFCGILQS